MAMHFELQEALGEEYDIERELGGGGMSRVFLANERALGRRVVIKLLTPDLAADVSIERFRREIQMTARLQHPHIVPILKSGEMDGLPYYTMPYVDGDSLRVRLLRTGAMPVREATSIVRDVAKALEFAHTQGIVHRDIKPDNILLAGNAATVSDFGVGKALAESRVHASSTLLTGVGLAIGTPQYMSPEQALGDAGVDHRTDLYALGCVAYELLAGEPPFAGLAPAALMRAQIVDTPTPIQDKRADVPDAFAALIARCMEKDPDHRPANAEEILTILEGVAASASLEPMTTPGRRPEILSVAVLPFSNLSSDEESGHFADGLTDEVITDLSALKTLRVTSRQSAIRFKDTDKAVASIASELGVRYVLTGSVRRSGPMLRISAQLVDARKDSPQWAEKFSGTLTDVFEIQEQISRQIVEALRLRLTPADEHRIAERPIRDVRAWEYYLLARQHAWGLTEGSLDQAERLVRQAREIVGENELLLAAEGQIWWQHVNVGLVPVDQYDDYLGKAESCVTRILELNAESSKAYGLRGMIRSNRAEPAGARQDFKRALALNPNDTDALLWLGYGYAAGGRPELARALMERLQQVDPLTSINAVMWGIVALMDGCHDEALQWTHRAVALEPSSYTNAMMHALTLAANGQRDPAIAVLDTVAQFAPEGAWGRLGPAMACALRGDRDGVVAVINPALRAAIWRDDILAWWAADCLALVGEADAALDILERAVVLGIVNHPFLARHDPLLEGIRATPRFGRFLEHVQVVWNAFQP
jgi:non-specific serine/threonine protein kinase